MASKLKGLKQGATHQEELEAARAEVPELERVDWRKDKGLRKLYMYCAVICVASATTGYDGYVPFPSPIAALLTETLDLCLTTSVFWRHGLATSTTRRVMSWDCSQLYTVLAVSRRFPLRKSKLLSNCNLSDCLKTSHLRPIWPQNGYPRGLHHHVYWCSRSNCFQWSWNVRRW